MRRRNRKVKKHSRFTVNSVNCVALIVLSFLALMVYWSQDARCSAFQQEIGKAEKEYKRLERDCQREISIWEELKTPDKLRVALLRHGLDMGQPNQDQVVHMTRAGKPEPNQMSVARIRQRNARGEVAALKGLSRPRTAAGARLPRQAVSVRR